MDSGFLKLVELALLFGGVLAFGVWQLRSVERDRRKRLAAEARALAQLSEPGPPAVPSDSSGAPAMPADPEQKPPAPTANPPAGFIKPKYSEKQLP